MNSAHRMFRFPSDGSMLVSIETTPKIAAAEPDKVGRTNKPAAKLLLLFSLFSNANFFIFFIS